MQINCSINVIYPSSWNGTKCAQFQHVQDERYKSDAVQLRIEFTNAYPIEILSQTRRYSRKWQKNKSYIISNELYLSIGKNLFGLVTLMVTTMCYNFEFTPVQKSLMFSHVTQLWINCGSGLNCMQILFFKRDFVRSTVKYFQTWNSQVRLKQSKNSHVNLTFEKWIGNLPLA